MNGAGLAAAATVLGLVAAGNAAIVPGPVTPDIGSSAVTPWNPPVKLAPRSFGVFDRGAALSDEIAAVIWAGARGVRVRVREPGVGWRRTVRLDGRGSDSPRISVNDRGDLAAAWTKTGPRRTLLRVARRPAGGQWTKPSTLARGTPAFGTDEPDVSIGPLGKITVALSYRRRGDSTSRPRVFSLIDGRWGRAVALTRRFGNSVRVVTGPEGHVTAAWLNNSGVRCVSNGAGRAWTRARCWKRPRTGLNMELAIDNTGRVYLMTYNRVWSRAPGTGWRREPVPFGKFVAFPEGEAFSIDSSSAGRAAVAWSHGRQTGRADIDWTTFASVRRTDGTWTPRVRLARRPAPSTAITDRGTTYVAWSGRLGIRVARKPAGQPWGHPRGIVGKPQSVVPLIVVNPEGNALLAFQRGLSRSSLWAAWRP